MRTFAPEIFPEGNTGPEGLLYSETVHSMKNLITIAAATVLTLLLASCENKTATIGNLTKKTGELTPGGLPAGKSDSIAGFKGCESAAFSPLTPDSDEFLYQHYTVIIKRKPNDAGEEVTVRRDSGRTDFVIPVPEAGRFYGILHGKLFIDAGTGPDLRHLFMFDLDKESQWFDTPYCGDVQIIDSERLYFLLPVEESEVAKKPDCPEKAEWEKNGLRAGYGQRSIFNFINRSLTRKSEWVCVPMQ